MGDFHIQSHNKNYSVLNCFVDRITLIIIWWWCRSLTELISLFWFSIFEISVVFIWFVLLRLKDSGSGGAEGAKELRFASLHCCFDCQINWLLNSSYLLFGYCNGIFSACAWAYLSIPDYASYFHLIKLNSGSF